MATLKVGVIGVGWFGEIHRSMIVGVPGLKLAAMEDGDAARLAEIGAQNTASPRAMRTIAMSLPIPPSIWCISRPAGRAMPR